MNFFYQYLLNPKKTLRFYSKTKQTSFWPFVILIAASFSYLQSTDTHNLMFMILLRIILVSIVLFLQVTFWDFIAQLFYKAEANSLRMFKWASLSLFPCILSTPFILISQTSLPFAHMINLIGQSTLSLSIAILQIMSIKFIYNLSYSRSTIIFLLPLVTFFVLLSLIMMISMTSLIHLSV